MVEGALLVLGVLALVPVSDQSSVVQGFVLVSIQQTMDWPYEDIAV